MTVKGSEYIKANAIALIALILSIFSTFYTCRQTSILEQQQKANLYIQAFYGDKNFLGEAEKQAKIPNLDSIEQFNGKQLVVVVSNSGGVPATITDIKTDSGEGPITKNGYVIQFKVNPDEMQAFNIRNPQIFKNMDHIKLYGFNNEVWEIKKENIYIQP